jgi:P2-related tail formation protein
MDTKQLLDYAKTFPWTASMVSVSNIQEPDWTEEEKRELVQALVDNWKPHPFPFKRENSNG